MITVENMLADGLFSKLIPTSDYWEAEFRISRTAEGCQVEIKNGVNWAPVSSKYNFTPVVEEMLQLVHNKNKAEYGLVVSHSGLVSIDKDKELLLMSAELKAKIDEAKNLKTKK